MKKIKSEMIKIVEKTTGLMAEDIGKNLVRSAAAIAMFL